MKREQLDQAIAAGREALQVALEGVEFVRTEQGITIELEDEGSCSLQEQISFGRLDGNWALQHSTPLRSLRVLVVEDKPEQQLRAQEALAQLGHTCVTCAATLKEARQMLQEVEVDMILTDLHFMSSPKDPEQCVFQRSDPAKAAEMPCGMLMVVEAMRLGLPVAIVTDGRHHDPADVGWIYHGYVQNNEQCPFVWDDYKDWHRAARLLERRAYAS